MRRPDFDALRRRFHSDGISQPTAMRMVDELHVHFDDLRADIEARGVDKESAAELACEQLGSLDVVADAVRAQPALRRLSVRYRAINWLLQPVALAGSAGRLAAPYAQSASRWLVGVCLSGLVTAALLLSLQLAIVFA